MTKMAREPIAARYISMTLTGAEWTAVISHFLRHPLSNEGRRLLAKAKLNIAQQMDAEIHRDA